VSIASVVIQHLIVTEEYARKVFPFLVSEYFKENVDRVLFEIIVGYVAKYNKFPSVNEVAIELTENATLSDIEFDQAKEFLSGVRPDPDLNLDWIVDKTETFCKDRAIEIAIGKAAMIIADEKNSSIKREGIPDLLQAALAVSFNVSIGHDYLEDWELRYDSLHADTIRIPFHIEFLNRITNGGLPPKSLTVILAGTGVGKSMLMCDMAAHNLIYGKNVLYITLELSEEMVSQRIDANLMDIEMELMPGLSKKTFADKIEKIKQKTHGKLIVEEFATSGAGASHFRHLLNDLKIKKKFVPDVVYIDYINICISTRYKSLGNANTYMIVKMIAEELRGLAVDFNIPIITATQLNRSGFGSSNPGMEDTAESWGLPQTADLMFTMFETEDLKELKQIMIKQLKNRFYDTRLDEKFVLGIERSKMRFLELEPSAQNTINNEKIHHNRKIVATKHVKSIPQNIQDKFEKFNK
jgi:Kyanoviridae DNA primase/helicase